MTYTLKITQSYLDDMDQLPKEIKIKKLHFAEQQLQENPHLPGLYSHKFNGFRKYRVFRSRVDDSYRIAWWYGGADQSIILWRVGNHEMIDALEKLKDLPHVDIKKVIKLVKEKPVEHIQAAHAPVRVQKNIPIFQHVSAIHLRLLGVPVSCLAKVQQITKIEDLSSIDLPNHARQHLWNLFTDPDWSPDRMLDIRQVLYRANAGQLEDYCKGQIKQLMLDLSADQEKVVSAQANGVLLIKGVAGSGKTTVGVYRALHLSRNMEFFTKKPILFLTYNETLTNVVNEIFLELTHKKEHANIKGRIKVSTLRDWCCNYLQGGLCSYSQEKADALLASCIGRIVPHDADYDFLKQENFIHVEISQVVKGRGIENWGQYRSVSRTGRGQPLGEGARKLIWDIYLAYQGKLKEKSVWDEADLILEAFKKVKAERDFEPYPEVVVDEAQDLPPKALELAALLAGGGRSHGLCLLADPSQSIYYRGISWKDANVQIHSSRVKTLRRNFRNTRQILEVAKAVSKADPNRSLEEALEPESTDRLGLKPHVYYVPDQSEQDLKFMKELILNYCGENRNRLGDIAVLYRSKEKAQVVRDFLRKADIPVRHFREDSFRVFEDDIKVITINSAKGLEFPVVILMNIDEGVLPRNLDHIRDKDDYAVALRSERKLFYVGLTRAADDLCLVITTGRQSRFIKDIPEDLIDIKKAEQES